MSHFNGLVREPGRSRQVVYSNFSLCLLEKGVGTLDPLQSCLSILQQTRRLSVIWIQSRRGRECFDRLVVISRLQFLPSRA